MPSGSPYFKQFVCKVCQQPFEKYVPPSDKRGTREFCSRSCQMKHTRVSNDPGVLLSGVIKIQCEECGKETEKYHKSRAPKPRFCSKSCASKRLVQTKGNAFSSLEKLPEDVREKLIEIRRASTTRRNTGKQLSVETKQKISASCAGIPNSVKGKTYVEFYGEERARELSQQHSEKLKEGFREGRIKPPARSSAPVYKGVRLRSKLELHTILLLESRGSEFGKTLFYEDSRVLVQWTDVSGVHHTYIPDLYDEKNGIVYEVKPAWIVESRSEELILKESAAVSQLGNKGIRFRYLTSKEVESSDCYPNILKIAQSLFKQTSPGEF